MNGSGLDLKSESQAGAAIKKVELYVLNFHSLIHRIEGHGGHRLCTIEFTKVKGLEASASIGSVMTDCFIF